MGNAVADALADQGGDLHAVSAHGVGIVKHVREQAEQILCRALVIVRMLGATTPDPLRVTKRVPALGTGRSHGLSLVQARRASGHTVITQGGRCSCSKCLSRAPKGRVMAWLLSHCGRAGDGHPGSRGPHVTHTLRRLGQYIYCSKCGYHGHKSVRQLGSPCLDTPKSGFDKFILQDFLKDKLPERLEVESENSLEVDEGEA